MVTFVHTADCHVGMTPHYLAGEAQPRFTADRIDAIRSIGVLAKEHGADFIVAAGDTFDNHNLSAQELGRALEAMGESGIPFYLLPGNHDPLSPHSLWDGPALTTNCPPSVHVIRDNGAIRVSDGVELLASPWTSKEPGKDPVSHLVDGLENDGTIRVALGHGMLDVLNPDSTSETSVSTLSLRDALEAGAIHYVALGDRHIGWPIDDPHAPIRYAGSPESTSFHEPHCGVALVVEVAGSKVTATEHRVGRWRHLVVKENINSKEDVDRLRHKLAAIEDKERAAIKTILRGTISMTESAYLEEMLAEIGPRFASINSWERHTDLVIASDSGDIAELGLGGFARTAAEELAEASGDGDTEAQDALKLLFRLNGGVR